VPLNRITCPECGAGLKSKSGFTPGELVSCPKCETDFTVAEPADEAEEPRKGKKPAKAAALPPDDEEEDEKWSYKNSWIRYAILGVLLVVLGVLGYMLYEKKKKEEARLARSQESGVRSQNAAVGELVFSDS
jgi:uncharacterized Zn finger protein (UPF0148 family)